MSIFRILIILASLISQVSAQIVFYDAPPYETEIDTRNFYSSSLKLIDSLISSGSQASRHEIFEIGSQKFLLIDGRLDVYQWQNLNWVNISKSMFHGYNFISKKFIWKGEIYSYGGYGFWREHGDLIKFDWNSNEWETVQLKIPYDIGNNVSFLQDSFLYIINPKSRNQHINQSVTRNEIFKINLNNLQVSNSESDIKLSTLKQAIRIETQHYFIASYSPLQIFQKEKEEYKFSDLTYLNKMFDHDLKSFFIIQEDSILLYANKNQIQPFIYNIKNIYAELPAIPVSIVANNNYTNPIIWILVLFTILIITKLNTFKVDSSKKITFDHTFIGKLVELSGNTLTQEELDQVFEIDKIVPAETQRFKRSTLINEINLEYKSKKGFELINRIHDKQDKRKYEYKITK